MAEGQLLEAVMALQIPDMTIQWAARHVNKLRLGHLKGNRFAIKIRDVNPTDVVKLRPMIDVLERRGMPNYFGEQRFGRRGNNDLLGAALIAGDNVRMLQLLLGSPDPAIDDSQTLVRARCVRSSRQRRRRCGCIRAVTAWSGESSRG